MLISVEPLLCNPYCCFSTAMFSIVPWNRQNISSVAANNLINHKSGDETRHGFGNENARGGGGGDRASGSPGEEGALAVGGVGEGVGAAGAEGDGDGAGARVAEPLGEPRRAVPRRPGMPEPLRARRHRPIEHRQHPFSPSQRSPPRVASSPDPIVRHPPRAVHDRCSSAGELYTEGVWR